MGRAWRALALGAMAMAAWNGVGACAAGFWSHGLSAEAPTNTPATANGMVLVMGEAGWRVAAQAIAKNLGQAHPDGLIFDASAQGSSVGVPSASSLSVRFEDAALHTGPVALQLDPLGVVLEIVAGLEPLEMTVEVGGQALCEVTVAFEHGLLRGRLALTRSKLGRIHAGGLSDVTLDAPGATIDLTDCPDLAAVAGAQFAGAGDIGLAEALLDSVGAEAFAALGPSLADAVPDALGLDLASDATAQFFDGVGEGWLRARVRASEAEQSGWWQLAGGRLNVPYAVAIEAKAHPCAVGSDPVPPAAQSIPQVAADAALLLADNVLAYAVWGLWRSGGLCGERASRDLRWGAAELLPGWPALAALPADAIITLRVWPDAAPQIAVEGAPAGPRARVAIPPWTLELYATIDGASVRLATLHAGLEIVAGLEVRPDRSVWLAPDSVAVTATGSQAGLFAAPESAIIERIAGPVANAIVAARPVWWLPAFPLGPHDVVSHEAGYLVFASRPAGGSD
jgi:hypothetical protein